MQCGGKNIRNYKQYILHLVFFSLWAFLLTVFVWCVLLSSYVYLLIYVFVLSYVYLLCLICICCSMCVLLFLLSMPDCWLEVSIRKVLRPITSTQVFLGFPVSTGECSDGSQVSSCYYMPLMQPSRLKFPSYFFFHICIHVN